MTRVFAIALAVVLGLSPVVAAAQERLGDAALGAISGAIVGGPIGAVAGVVIGYTAGPNIARGWGIGTTHATCAALPFTTAPLPPKKEAAKLANYPRCST
jgi:hypothetical protein